MAQRECVRLMFEPDLDSMWVQILSRAQRLQMLKQQCWQAMSASLCSFGRSLVSVPHSFRKMGI